jgi:hypothetical protein
MAGTEPTRVAIGEAARRVPATFALGFSEAVADAVFAGAAFDAMVAELSDAAKLTSQ